MAGQGHTKLRVGLCTSVGKEKYMHNLCQSVYLQACSLDGDSH